MMGILATTIIFQIIFLLPTVRGDTLEPEFVDSRPEIDGIFEKDTYEKFSKIIFTDVNDTVLDVYSFCFGDYVYFGLMFKTSIHNENESFAIACSNNAPGSSETTSDIFTYDTVKTISLDKRTWDQDIINQNEAENFTDDNYIFSDVGLVEDNHSFYEIGFPRNTSLTRDTGLRWDYGKEYIFALYYGTQYKNETSFFEPDYAQWEYTGQNSIIIPQRDDDLGDDPTFNPLQIDIIVTKSIMYIFIGIVVGVIGLYIFRTKKRIRRI